MTDQTQIEAFAAKLSAMMLDHHVANKNAGLVASVICERGPKFTRLVRQEATAAGEVISRCAYGFVENETGNLLKSDGWKRPAKGIRSNIESPDVMLRCSPWSAR